MYQLAEIWIHTTEIQYNGKLFGDEQGHSWLYFNISCEIQSSGELKRKFVYLSNGKYVHYMGGHLLSMP